MKTLVLAILMIVGIGLLSSCTDDDGNSSQEKTIDGTWNLTKVRGGYGGVVITDYQKGDIKWVFKQSNNTLTIENRIESDNNLLLQSGIYSYSIEDDGDTQIITLENEITMIILPVNTNLRILETNNTHGRTAEFKR